MAIIGPMYDLVRRTSDHPLMDRYDISDRLDQHYIFSLSKVGASLNTFAVVKE